MLMLAILTDIARVISSMIKKERVFKNIVKSAQCCQCQDIQKNDDDDNHHHWK